MKSEKQKQKILYIEKYLREHTDEFHPASTPQIIAYLEEQGIKAERKSIYSDIDHLIEFGVDIEKVEGNRGGYYMASREFDLPEVKLLVDLVQSSKFITEKKSRELIKKLECLVPHQDAVTLQRQVVVSDRNKTINESIYYSVDVIYEAMAKNHRVCFQYFEWDENKSQALRRGGAVYEASPWLLTFDDQKYYLIAYDSEAKMMKHYRVDKMLHISLSDNERDGKEQYESVNLAAYGKSTFGMFAGKTCTVRMSVNKALSGVIVDRFGTDVAMRKLDEEHLAVRAEVNVSPMFFGWLAGLNDQIKLLGPDEVVEEYKDFVSGIAKLYQEEE